MALCSWWCYNTESQKCRLEGPFLETCSPFLASQSEADSNSLWQSRGALVLCEPLSQMAKGCSVEEHRSQVPIVSNYRQSHTVLSPSACPWQKEPNSMLTFNQTLPWPPSQQSSPSCLFYSRHLNCSTFQLGKKVSLSGACRSQVVSIPRARQDTVLPVRVNTESHAKHLSFWLGLSSQYSHWKGRGFTETERLFSSGLETTCTFNHIWNPVCLKAAHFVGRMYIQISPLPSPSAGSLHPHSGICCAGTQPRWMLCTS